MSGVCTPESRRAYREKREAALREHAASASATDFEKLLVAELTAGAWKLELPHPKFVRRISEKLALLDGEVRDALQAELLYAAKEGDACAFNRFRPKKRDSRFPSRGDTATVQIQIDKYNTLESELRMSHFREDLRNFLKDASRKAKHIDGELSDEQVDNGIRRFMCAHPLPEDGAAPDGACCGSGVFYGMPVCFVFAGIILFRTDVYEHVCTMNRAKSILTYDDGKHVLDVNFTELPTSPYEWCHHIKTIDACQTVPFETYAFEIERLPRDEDTLRSRSLLALPPMDNGGGGSASSV